MSRPRPDRAVAPRRPDPAAGADAAPASLYLAADDGSRRMRAALAVAVAVHALLLLAPMPPSAAEVPEPEKKEYRVVPTPRFKPPEPPPEEPVVERIRRVPIPDPDPTDVEPLRPIGSLEPVDELPPLGAFIAFPESPPEPEPEHAGPYVIGGPVSAPVRLEAPLPLYPEIARRIRKQCTVILRSVIDETGRVTEIEVAKPCSFGLDEAAVEAVERWRYRPATLGERPVPVYMTLQVVFSVD